MQTKNKKVSKAKPATNVVRPPVNENAKAKPPTVDPQLPVPVAVAYPADPPNAVADALDDTVDAIEDGILERQQTKIHELDAGAASACATNASCVQVHHLPAAGTAPTHSVSSGEDDPLCPPAEYYDSCESEVSFCRTCSLLPCC